MIAKKNKIVFLMTPTMFDNTNLYSDIINGIKKGNPKENYVIHNLEDHNLYLNHKYIYDKTTSDAYRIIHDSGFLGQHNIDYDVFKKLNRNKIFIESYIDYITSTGNIDDTHIIIGLENIDMIVDLLGKDSFLDKNNYALITMNDYNPIEKVGYHGFVNDLYNIEFGFQVVCEDEYRIENAIAMCNYILDLVFVKQIGSYELEEMVLATVMHKNYRIENFDRDEIVIISFEKLHVEKSDFLSNSITDYKDLDHFIESKIDYLFSVFTERSNPEQSVMYEFDHYMYGLDLISNLKVLG